MKEIKVNIPGNNYSIFIGKSIYQHLPGIISEFNQNRQAAVISTPPVSGLYLKKVTGVFDRRWKLIHFDVADGEQSKSLETAQKIYTWLIENRFERDSVILALGGGVIGDLAGFVAATYLRGVNLVHLPTSLLAQVDSSIGGKVGVNHALGKNMIGAFYQPKCVVSDISVLSTLAKDEYICGLGEVVKYGIISNKMLFEKIENNFKRLLNFDAELLEEIVLTCAEIKADIVSKDEKESGIRAILNFGHTFGHALETYFQHNDLKHGQAVLLGMKCATFAASKMNLIDPEKVNRISNLIDKFEINLPANSRPLNAERLFKIMQTDKKVKKGKINLILPVAVGRVIIKSVENEKLIAASFNII